MTMHPIPTYRDDAGNTVTFVKLANAPGFTHRVIINRKQVAWLSSTYKPSVKAAEYFMAEHGHKAPLTATEGATA